jgi:glycosyltransferase involved in cell wall biosynthesis
MYVLYNDQNVITAVSDTPVESPGQKALRVSRYGGDPDKLIGKWVYNGGISMHKVPKEAADLRVAVICNWNDRCGISTYSKYLVTALRPKVKELRVFSEHSSTPTAPDEEFVSRCWRRGERMRPAVRQVLDWKPDFVIVQHEYGIFPHANHFFQMMQMLEGVPTVTVMHSVYEHLDKAVYSSACKEILVHSEEGRQVLLAKGSPSSIHVVPHGCVTFPDVNEIFNIVHTPFTVLQFGFGFQYKGVERVLESLSLLKKASPKYEDVFYCFLLSSNGHNTRAHDEYYNNLLAKVGELNLEDNVAILRQFSTDEMLNLFLRTFKVAVFPYVTTPDNTVYGASGAARVAMANGIPVVVSKSHLFDDLEGVLPRAADAAALAKELSKIFNDGVYRRSVVGNAMSYVRANTWDVTADRYLGVYREIAVK